MFKILFLPALALLVATPFAMAQSEFAGDWSGTLGTPSGDVEVIFHVTESANELSATLDVPQQGATGIAASAVSAEGSELTMEFTDIQTTVTGTKTAEGTIDATWSQAGQEVPVTLSPAEAGGFEAEAAPAEGDSLEKAMPVPEVPEAPETPTPEEAVPAVEDTLRTEMPEPQVPEEVKAPTPEEPEAPMPEQPETPEAPQLKR